MKQYSYESSPFQEVGKSWNLKQTFENEARLSDAFWEKAFPKMMHLIDANSDARGILLIENALWNLVEKQNETINQGI